VLAFCLVGVCSDRWRDTSVPSTGLGTDSPRWFPLGGCVLGAIMLAMADRLAASGVTRKEAEVLGGLREHLTNAEIAARMYVSERTVETHVSSLLRKLGASNRRELARLARSAGVTSMSVGGRSFRREP
jgi:DNA-binding CsgD family transcriptional regulator